VHDDAIGPSSPSGAEASAPSGAEASAPSDRSPAVDLASCEVREVRGAPASAPRPAPTERIGVIALYFGYRAVAGVMLAAPASILAASLVNGQPRGDAVLFDAGGAMLIEVARVARVAAIPVAAPLGRGTLLAAAFGLVPLAVLLAALGRGGRLSAAFVAGRVAQSIGTLALLWGVATAAEVAAAVLVALPGLKLLTAWSLGPPLDDLATLGVALAAILAAGAIGVVHDLARVVAVDAQCGFYTAASRAVLAAQFAPLAAAWAFVWRATLALIVVVTAAWATQLIGLSSAPRIALVLGVQHAALALAAFLRASWLAAAIRLLDRARAASQHA
jgi:hypothetical protein